MLLQSFSREIKFGLKNPKQYVSHEQETISSNVDCRANQLGNKNVPVHSNGRWKSRAPTSKCPPAGWADDTVGRLLVAQAYELEFESLSTHIFKNAGRGDAFP